MKDLYDSKWRDLPYLDVYSEAFSDGEHIPALYTCDWENHFPRIIVSWIPEEVESLVLIVDDPDAPERTFTHLIAWNILTTWDKVIIDEDTLIDAKIWKNDFGNHKWWWPCPPKWDWIHHYYFKIYWIDTDLELPYNISKEELISEMDLDNNAVAYWELIWEYER